MSIAADAEETKTMFKMPDTVIVDLPDVFSDERGEIIPLVDENMKSCVMINSKKGSVRANHYHKTDWHYCYVLTGEILYFHRPTGSDETPEEITIKQGQMFFTPPMVDHAMLFTKDTTFLTFGRNSRDQEVYESDIVRIDPINKTLEEVQ